jgi:iron complex outermembrane receptor protein
MKRTNRRIKSVGAIVGLWACIAWVSASAVTVHIDSQPLPMALRQFVAQSGIQVLFPSGNALDSWTAPRVVGEFAPSTALAQLLAGSGLRYEFVNSTTVAVRDPDSDVISGPQQDAGRSSLGSEKASSERGIPEVLVNGSRSLNADVERTPDDIQPYVVIGRKQIDHALATNVSDLLRTFVTMNYVSSPSELQGPENTSVVALRGLSSSQTLILVDGRRVSGRGRNGFELQPDLNGIPLSAIERIEILPTTASGIYGGSATGGVVNIVLRREYSGLEARADYSGSFAGGGRGRRLDLSGGLSFNNGDTSLMFLGSFGKTDPLLIGQRRFPTAYIARADANSQSFQPNYLRNGLPPLSSTANISAQPNFIPVAEGTPGAFCISGECSAYLADDLVLKPEFGGASLGTAITHLSPGSSGVQSYLRNAG